MNRKDLPTIDPMRPKEWRWKEAHRLVDLRHKCQRGDGHDVWTREAQHFIRRNRVISEKLFHTDITKDTLTRKLKEKFPYLGYAHDMYVSSKCIRWAVEAYLMCNESAESIADMVGTSEAVIDYYKKLFFDVEDRLDKSLYINGEILGPALTNGGDPQDYDFYWKFVAYKFGKDVFNAVFTGDQGVTDAVTQKIDEGIRIAARNNALKATQTRSINGFTAGEVMNEYIAIERLKTDSQEGGAAKDLMRDMCIEGAFTLLDSIETQKKALKPRDGEYRNALGRLVMPEISVSKDEDSGQIAVKD